MRRKHEAGNRNEPGDREDQAAAGRAESACPLESGIHAPEYRSGLG